MSLPDRDSSKTARIYVDRLLPWLEEHRDVPFFVFLHVSDPHDPYEPAAPYATMWSAAADKERHERENKDVRSVIQEPLLKAFGMPTRNDLEKAGFDADAYVDYDRGWYDGSIRAMDAEIGRLRERLSELGLDRRTLVVLMGDHGEEFLEHGRTFHGQSAYGELANVPLIFWRPGAVPAGKRLAEVIETIDIMPTLLEEAGLSAPAEIQGRSLLGLISGDATAWRPRPAFTEKNVTTEPVGAPPPLDTESFAVVDGEWKLIHNTVRPRGGAEFELYDALRDPLDQKDVAAEHPEIVARLGAQLAAWRRAAEAKKLPADADAAATLDPASVARLRSLGYLQ
jgi:arylsulfatase A-like enzyme